MVNINVQLELWYGVTFSAPETSSFNQQNRVSAKIVYENAKWWVRPKKRPWKQEVTAPYRENKPRKNLLASGFNKTHRGTNSYPTKTVAILWPAVDCPVHPYKAWRSSI